MSEGPCPVISYVWRGGGGGGRGWCGVVWAEPGGSEVPCLGARVGLGGGAPCMAMSNAFWVIVTWETARKTDTTESITFPQLCWRAANIQKLNYRILIHTSFRLTNESRETLTFNSFQFRFCRIYLIRIYILEPPNTFRGNYRPLDHKCICSAKGSSFHLFYFEMLKFFGHISLGTVDF